MVEAESGTDGFTSVGALEASANAFLSTYVQASGDKTAAGVKVANKVVDQRRNVVDSNGKKINDNGDQVEATKVN